MSRIQCKGCKSKPSEHDTLSGYCLICADKRVQSHDKLVEALKLDSVLSDLNTIKHVLEESSPHNQEASHIRPVDCKCGYCMMETMACRSHIKLEQAIKEIEEIT